MRSARSSAPQVSQWKKDIQEQAFTLFEGKRGLRPGGREDDYRTVWEFLPETNDAPCVLCSVISSFIKI
jgi:hypothetical protein